MPYADHFNLADDLINHLDTIVSGLPDPFIKSRYIGFVSVAAVTVYELAIKTAFVEFAQKKHQVLGIFTASYFDRINGRIRLNVIKDDYLKRFGEKYVKRFDGKVIHKETEIVRSTGASIKAAYGNIITWRNHFAHEGKIPSTVTYEEVCKAYSDGKHVIHCLAESLVR